MLKLEQLEESLARTDKLINRIEDNPDDYEKENLQKLVDAMTELIKIAEAKLAQK